MFGRMKNRFEFTYKTQDADLGCEFMDWLNENRVEYTISLEDVNAERKTYVFYIHATRMNVADVMHWFGEEC